MFQSGHGPSCIPAASVCLREPSARYTIDWVVTQQQIMPHPRYPHWRKAEFHFLGMDQPGLLARIAAVFREHQANIESVQFLRVPDAPRYYDLRIHAIDEAPALERVIEHFNRRPLVYTEFPAALVKKPLVTVPEPPGLELDLMLEDDIGLIAELSDLIAAECLLPSAKLPLTHNGSFVRLSGIVESDGGFAESGTPGFHIQAQIAAPDQNVVERLRRRLEQFRNDHIVSQFELRPLARVEGPVRFLSVAQYDHN